MKKLTVSSKKLNQVPKEFQPEWFANRMLLAAEFEDGKEAFVKYSRGKLTIIVGKKPKRLD